jgi:hypothetical protein
MYNWLMLQLHGDSRALAYGDDADLVQAHCDVIANDLEICHRALDRMIVVTKGDLTRADLVAYRRLQTLALRHRLGPLPSALQALPVEAWIRWDCVKNDRRENLAAMSALPHVKVEATYTDYYIQSSPISALRKIEDYPDALEYRRMGIRLIDSMPYDTGWGDFV